MATQENLNLAQQLYVAYYGRPADAEGLEFWAEEIEARGAQAVVGAFGTSEEYTTRFGDLENEELVNGIYQQSFGRDADAEGLAFYVEKLESGEQDLASIALTIVQNATNTDEPDADTLANKVAAADLYTEAAGDDQSGTAADNYAAEFLAGIDASTDLGELDIAEVVAGIPQPTEPEEPTEPSNPGETFVLTEGRDNLTGTDADDTFVGLVGQNQNGAVSNALSTGDILDGGAGRDKIEASLINDQKVDAGDVNFGTDALYVAPRTTNIEETHIEALDGVVLDAGRMDSVEEFWSDNSDRSGLFIDDVRLGSKLSVTKDITFGMRSVDTDSDLRAAFDTNSLTKEGPQQSNSQLMVRVADVTTATPETPLANVELTIGFSVDGENYVLEDVRSTDGTYAGLQEAVKAQLDELGLNGYNVELANPYNQVTVAGNTVNLPFTAQEILVTDPEGNAFSNVSFDYNSVESVDDEFLVAGTAQPVEPDVSTTLIETNLILDNAGRGSTAGDAIIGGMSNSQKVIEKLNLEVDRSSKVDNVLTAHGMTAAGQSELVAFEQIEVTSGAAEGDLSIENVGNVYNFDATAFTGENLSVAGQAGLDSTANDWAPNAENKAHVYNTSASNDSITVDYSLDKAAEFNGFSLGINTGAGNDTVHTIAQGADDFSLPNQQDLQHNVVVNTGEGDDVVWTEGAGGVLISTGAGNDTIYSDNSGLSQMNSDLGATWLVNTQNTAFDDLRGNAAGLSSGQTTPAGNDIPAVLYGAQLTVTLAGASLGGAVTSAAADSFDNGFEGIINLNDILGDRVFGDQRDINAAIAQVVNNHKVLSKLLVAENGPDNSLVIRSQVDGQFEADDLQITLSPAGVSGMSDSAKGRLESAIREESNDSNFDGTDANLQAVLNGSTSAAHGINGIGTGGGVQADTYTGTASTADNTGNEINAGSGSDVIVLSTNGDSNETIVFEDNFDRNTVVNFDADGTSAGADTLDFTAYLGNEEFQGSTSAESRDTFPTVGFDSSTTSAVTANNVITINDFAAGTGNAADETWGGLTAENLLAAIQNGNNAGYGSIVDGTLDVSANVADLVGNTVKSVVMIENDNNAGEYKVFELTGSGVNDANTANEFTDASLVGIVDFGNEIDASAVNLA
ncbi:DUF4214 domain-containing protein [Vreelandella titanicae]|uniref:DUF4214 domain-containing protein n=1 Tax=Vreelandella titanicae TaxID=664683 RepID=UPI001681572F|nr:DUF4214 domain-containing protein [Halomonas titanicae]QNU62196.1 DUF4214 domain-containing protein [Halomonas titanicae]